MFHLSSGPTASLSRVLMLGLGLFSLPAASAPASAAGDSLGEENIIGEWWTEERDGRVAFFKAKTGTYTGRLTWSKKPRKDVENEDPKLRTREVVGIILIWKLKYEDGEFVDGKVYNPEDGGIYSVEVESIDRNTIKVRGFVGISLLGQSQVWTRYR
jgi:uncharacterized protein (DUF2147 family)